MAPETGEKQSAKTLRLTEWLDYLRGFTDGECKDVLESHCQQCSTCNGTVEWLIRTITDAAGDRESVVPKEVIENARVLFSARALNHEVGRR